VTTDAVEPVGQAVIKNVTVNGSTVRFEAEAPHATTFTYLHKAPGQQVFAVVQANTTEKVVSLAGLAVGEHSFKAFGANSQGIGPESAEAAVLVARRRHRRRLGRACSATLKRAEVSQVSRKTWLFGRCVDSLPPHFAWMPRMPYSGAAICKAC
jgi:hypothetical protein